MKIQALSLACGLVFLSSALLAAQNSPPIQSTSATTNVLDSDLADFRMDKLQAGLEKMPHGPQRDFIAGLMANRRGQINQSIELLKRALPAFQQTRDARASEALKTLADDYTKAQNYSAAAHAYEDLFASFPAENHGGTKDDAGVVRLLSGTKPMTITWHGPARAKTARNAIGSMVINLDVNGIKEPWLLDTGANYSLVSKSFAQKLGLKILPGSAQTGSGLTGLENSLQAAIISSMQVGGALLQNVVVLVFDDANLRIHFGDRSYQINALLGYPVFQAMGAITFTHDGLFEAGKAADQGGTGIPMYMRRLTPVVNLKANGVLLPFTLDTGASGTELSVRYYEKFKSSGLSWTPGEEETGGVGGNVRRKIYTQPIVQLGIGDKTAILKDVSVLPQKTNSGLDELYGNIGQNMFADFESVTFDFAHMTFRIGPSILRPASP